MLPRVPELLVNIAHFPKVNRPERQKKKRPRRGVPYARGLRSFRRVGGRSLKKNPATAGVAGFPYPLSAASLPIEMRPGGWGVRGPSCRFGIVSHMSWYRGVFESF
jgi:hypothetical protein